ncbi:MAG TPA: hypothetical protein VHM90_01645 [Phycisphaerae bacterium]|jgi:hypothetical protein|nr:hypothetical protein [Phycisphaerae bacterium]
MLKNSSVWMAVLTFTAVIMGAIILSSNDRRADAAMLNAQTNFSLMTTGINGGDEALIVIDKAQQKMILYVLKGNELTPLTGSKL